MNPNVLENGRHLYGSYSNNAETLENLAKIVSRGHRDNQAMKDIVARYNIPNDAGIGEAIVAETLATARNVLENS